MQYNEIEFGNDENKITITLLEETMGKGLMGMLSSTIFKENIAARRNFEHIEAAQEGRFARARCADNANDVALKDVDADAL